MTTGTPEKLSPEYLDHRWVLDKGECSLLGYFGSDKLIADTARVSYRKGTKQTSTDKQLIRYLVRNRHTSPLEHAVVRFYVKAPLFVIQQLLRHRSFSFNQASARYSEMLNESYVPLPEHITTQDAKNKQARTDTKIAHAERISNIMEGESVHAFDHYNLYLKDGVARELARINVPHGTYSELIVTCDLHNLLNFLALRLSPHAQYEIRVYAEAMYDFVKGLFPAVIEAWEDCSLKAFTLTGQMQEVLANAITSYGEDRGDVSWLTNVRIASEGYSWASKSEKAQFEAWAHEKLQVETP